MVRAGREKTMKRSVFFTLFILMYFFFSLSSVSFANQGSDMVLDADKVSYDQASGMAEAEGSSRLRHENIRIFSHRMELDTVNQVAYASSKAGEFVTILYGDNRFTGKELQYDMTTKEGVLTDATGDLPAGMHGGTVYIRGKNLEVAPLDSALEKKWLKKKQTRRVKEADQEVSRWTKASLTTCPQSKPHYRLETKHLVVIPGVRVIAKNPRVYIAERFLFSYPFDYVIPLHGEKDTLLGIFVPSVVYDSDKGVGYALTGPLAWETGELNMAFRYWSEIELEARVGVNQRVGKNFSLFANTEYSYEEFDDESGGEKIHRPSWGVRSFFKGWESTLQWSQREKLSIYKDFGKPYENVLHREPEFTVRSPWWTVKGLPDFSWRVGAVWGEYEEARERKGFVSSSSRLVGELQAQYIVKTGDIRPFWRGQYRKFTYSDANDRGDDSQEILNTWVGFRTRLGEVDFANAWFVQNVSGQSPMSWDDVNDREVFYSEMGVSIGTNLYFSAMSSYDVKKSRLGEMAYRLLLDQDCSQWELIFKDDHVNDDEDWTSLRFIVKAFPKTPLVFGDKKLSNPFPNQGKFKGKKEKEKGIPVDRPIYDEDWDDDGLTYKSDPTEVKETGENPASSKTGESSGED